MIKIVMPISGDARQFAERGYTFPKPLVEIAGRPMIDIVAQNLRPADPHQFVFVCRQQHVTAFALADVLSLATPGCRVITVSEPTGGALCTVLLAAEEIDDGELLICNGDQYIEHGVDSFLESARAGEWDGYIMTFPSSHPKWSYVRVEDGEVVAVAEKRPISRQATTGVYYFRSGQLFLKAAEQMLIKNATVAGQFFVCPVYNELVLAGARVGAYPIPQASMHSLGTPEDVEAFAQSEAVRRLPQPSC